MNENLSRRSFLGASAGFAAAGLSAVTNPIAAAAQSVGVKPADLPDLTIKEVKVYVTDISSIHKLNSPETVSYTHLVRLPESVLHQTRPVPSCHWSTSVSAAGP